MELIEYEINNQVVAEVISDDLVISSVEDGTDLVGNLYYQQYSTVIVHQKNIISDFFNLRTGLAGEILQKFSNYRMRLFVVGDFKQHTSKSLQEFIFESNKGNHVNFVSTLAEAKSRLLKSSNSN